MAENLIGKVPPQDLDAEAAILGAILLHSDAADEVAQSLKPDQFYKKANSLIYETLLGLRNTGKPLDQIILKGELQKRGILEEVGGVSYLAELVDSVPSAANATYYARIVSEKSMLRNLISTTAEIQDEAFTSAESTDKVLDDAERRIFAVTQRRISTSAQPISAAITEVFDHLRNMREGTNKRGIPSGFGLLDDMTHGFHPGELTILAARPSMGKTSLALSFIRNMCLYEGKAAAFFSLEVPQLQVAANLLCNIAQVDSKQLRGGYIRRDDERRLLDAAELLSEARVYVDDCPALSTMELRAKGRRLKAQYDIGAIIIDYLQLMTGSGNSRDGRQVEVSEISRMLKALARELDIPVIALAQLSRKVEERPDHKPRMSDLRESGSIEQDADVVLLLYRAEYYRPDDESVKGLGQIVISKNRNGPTGEVNVSFQRQYTRFDNLSDQQS
jgi:replicative DNA helicase